MTNTETDYTLLKDTIIVAQRLAEEAGTDGEIAMIDAAQDWLETQLIVSDFEFTRRTA